jgi:hypothetical protein
MHELRNPTSEHFLWLAALEAKWRIELAGRTEEVDSIAGREQFLRCGHLPAASILFASTSSRRERQVKRDHRRRRETFSSMRTCDRR